MRSLDLSCAADDLRAPGSKMLLLLEKVGQVTRLVIYARGREDGADGSDLRHALLEVAAVAATWAQSLGR